MDPVTIIQRKRSHKDTDYDKGCFFCQRSTGDLRKASIEGKTRAKTVGAQRIKHADTTYQNVLKRLENVADEDFQNLEIKWHKNCYLSFTSEEKLVRLKNRRLKPSPIASTSIASEPSCSGKSTATRSLHPSIDWSLCMFCQAERDQKIHMVETLEKSKDLIDRAKKDPIMSTRLSGISDLIAAEGCYHLPCLIKFERRRPKSNSTAVEVEGENAINDECMMRLCGDLCVGLSRGHVYDMGDVWDRYNRLCEEKKVPIDERYRTRRATFHDEVRRLVGPQANYVQPLTKGRLMMYPGEKSDFLNSKSLTKSQEREMHFSTSDSETTDDEGGGKFELPHSNIFQEMVHVALHVRQDLLDTPGHTSGWQRIDEKHVDEVIPESLYLFFRPLFGGVDVVHNGLDEDDNIKQTVCSIAQDLVYAVSKNRKLTQKHIGLGLALHQATRSEALVDLFHAANHTIGIDTVRRIDTSIAHNILDKFAKNGNVYIPDNIVKERMIHCSCDNIDVLEATLDGKNTFHCTQMMVWQRGPPPQQDEVEMADLLIKRERAIKSGALQEFQRVDHATTSKGERPSPSYGGDKQIDVAWFDSKGIERPKSRGNDMAWMACRISDNEEDPSIPGWRAFNEAASTGDRPVTTAGMLPILQAPADDNNTLTTVINRFKDISRHVGQRHTIITADQPLYSRGKELVWPNPQFNDVIFLMGGLHICFNFLKAIGQHMESTGLDDLWTESGLYAANSTDAMLEGKAYYRAVRGHQLTYEALWHLKWQLFESWCAKTGRKHGADTTKHDDVIEHFKNITTDQAANLTASMHHLAQVLIDGESREALDCFEKQHSDDPNFQLWSTYMDMVQLLLDFFRAQREGNWNLHLESFAAMLPWLTVYDHNN